MRGILQKYYLLVASYLNPVYWVLDKKTNTILDVGCGDGKNGTLLMNRGKYKITGIDIYEPGLIVAEESGSYHKIIKRDISKLNFKNESFDTVLCLQVIEHLEKRKALALIAKIEKIAKEQVIITTPIGELKQGQVAGNLWQVHRSYYTEDEFLKRGYKIIKIGNRWFSSQEGIQRCNLHWLIRSSLLFLDILFTPFYFVFPYLANHYYFAYKDLNLE